MLKKTMFICQITEDYLKVLKCLVLRRRARKFIAAEACAISQDTEEKKIAGLLGQMLKKLKYRNDPVIISLPRKDAACRLLKVPAQAPDEIEDIVSLQAPRFLPYGPGELISAYQLIRTDKEGYSDINLVIAHKDVIERVLRIFEELKTPQPKIILSSYGLRNFCESKEAPCVMAADIDSGSAELAIISGDKLIFSRAFKLIKSSGRQELFVEEIKKTCDAYLKETGKDAPASLILLGGEKDKQEWADVLKKQTAFDIKSFSYAGKINLLQDASAVISNSEASFVSLMGLGLRDTEENLVLAAREKREEAKKTLRKKEYLQLAVSIFAAVLALGLAVARHLENKSIYLNLIKTELAKTAKDAKPLEDLEKRFNLLESESEKKISALEMLCEFYQAVPASVSLASFSCEEDRQVILRGQTQEMSSLFLFVSQLEKAKIFKDFDIKIRYASNRKTFTGETIDFEIDCLKENEKNTKQ